MKKTRKLLSLLLAASMLPVSFAAHAEEEAAIKGVNSDIPYGWELKYHTYNTSWNKEQDYVGIAYGKGVDGTNALYAHFESPIEAHRYVRATIPVEKDAAGAALKPEANATYNVSFKAKEMSGRFYLRTGFKNEVLSDKFTKGTTDTDGFTEYTYTWTLGNDVADTFDLFFDVAVNFVMDDFSIKKDGVECVANGDMEKVEYSFDTADDRNGMSSDWRYEWKEKLGSFDRSTSYFAPSRRYARSGEYALYLSNSYAYATKEDGTLENSEQYIQLINKNTITFDAGTYHMEFWAKLNGATNQILLGIPWLTPNYICTNVTGFKETDVDENGWVKYEQDFVLGEKLEEKTFRIIVQGVTNGVIDDLKLYKTDDDAKTNILKNGDFENSIRDHYQEGIYSFEAKNVGDGWLRAEGNNPFNEKVSYIEPTDEESYDGNYSAHFYFNRRDGVKANLFGRLVKTFDNIKENATYTVSFYMKGYGHGLQLIVNGADWDDAKGFTDENSSQAFNEEIKSFGTNFQKGETDENGWAQYTTTYTGVPNRVCIRTRSNVDCYIDKIEIYKSSDTTKTNLFDSKLASFEEGSFSKIGERETSIVHPMAFPVNGGKGLNISWTNPDSNRINSIDVFVDGKLYKNCALNLRSGAFNEMLVTGLENNKEYPIEIVMNIDGKIEKATFTGMPDAAGNEIERGGWIIDRKNGLKKTSASGVEYPNYSNAVFTLDSTTAKSGNNSMRLDINLPTKKDNCYPNIHQYVTVYRDTEYEFELTYKTDGIKECSVTVQYLSDDGYSSWETIILPASEDWTTKKISLKDLNIVKKDSNGEVIDSKPVYVADDHITTYDMRVIINAQLGTGSMWIDDVGLYEMDGNKREGENLYTNGGFDDYTYEIEEPVYKIGNKTITNVESGKVDVTAKIKNYAVNNIKGLVVVALYKNNQLVQTATVEKDFLATPLVIPAEEITQQLSVPEDISDGEYVIKLFMWKGDDTNGRMEPLYKCSVLKEAQTEAED